MGHCLCSLCIPFLYQKTELILERRKEGGEKERRGEGDSGKKKGRDGGRELR